MPSEENNNTNIAYDIPTSSMIFQISKHNNLLHAHAFAKCNAQCQMPYSNPLLHLLIFGGLPDESRITQHRLNGLPT